MKNALDIGRAAEYLVCADLLLQGVQCFPTDQGLPYDLIAEVDGRLIKIQVKATLAPRNVNASGRNARLAYSWNIRRRGRRGMSQLTERDCEVLALVALDIRQIAYFPIWATRMTVQLEPARDRDSINGRTLLPAIDQYPFSTAISGKTHHYTSRPTEACPNGHPYTAENTHHNARQRTCRTCARIAARRQRAARRARDGVANV